MSPTEFDLQSALHDGEDDGQGLDVDRIIHAGQARRAQRRAKLLSAAAVVVFVAAGATGLAALRHNDNPTASSADANSAATYAQDGAAGGAQAPVRLAPTSIVAGSAGGPTKADRSPSATVHSTPARTLCPRTMPHLLLPGGGSPGQFGSTGALFSAPVHTLALCVYGTTRVESQYRGVDAQTLVASLESAAKYPSPCPSSTGGVIHLAFVGVRADGTKLPVVTISYRRDVCSRKITNGTALRYGWTPPAGFDTRLATLLGGPNGTKSTNAGSPDK